MSGFTETVEDVMEDTDDNVKVKSDNVAIVNGVKSLSIPENGGTQAGSSAPVHNGCSQSGSPAPVCIKKEDRKDESSNHPFKHSNDTSDLRLVVEGRPLYVSRVVLSLVSPVLKSLFARDGDNTVELQLPGRKHSHMVEFLKCVYPDILAPITENTIDFILPLAAEYKVQRLIEKCEEFLVSDIKTTNPKPHPDKIVQFLNIADKYELEALQKATFETAAKTESDLLENVQDFWDLPSVTTTSVFIRRLKLLEQYGKNVRTKIKEVQNHCSLYHKGDREANTVCTKCYANIGKHAQVELKLI